MNEVRVEPVLQQSVATHIALAQTSYDTALQSDYAHFWWKHGSSPFGASTSVNLYNSQAGIIGRAVIQPRTFHLDQNTTCSAGVVTDLLLSPEYRTAINFLMLVRGQSKVSGMELLVHTSNSTSDPLYRKLLRYPVAFNLDAYAVPVRARNLLSEIIKRPIPSALEVFSWPWRKTLRALSFVLKGAAGITFKPGLPPDDELKHLLEKFRSNAGPHFERSREFVEWRFLRDKSFYGTVKTMFRNGELIGYIVWRKVSLEGLDFLVLMDIVLDKSPSRIERWALWLELVRLADDEGADLVFTMINSSNPMLSKIAGAPAFRIPESRLPHPTPIFVLPQVNGHDWLRAHESTYLTLADIDYF